MTVKALIEQLQEFDENLPVFVRTGTLVYEEAEYAEPNTLRKCTYSSRYHASLLPLKNQKIVIDKVSLSV